MAQRRQGRKSALEVTAEAMGRTLGQAARAVDSLQARHPDPAGELHQAVTAGAEKLATLAGRGRARETAAAKTTQAALQRAKRAGTSARRKATALLTRATQAVRRAAASSSKKTSSSKVSSRKAITAKASSGKKGAKANVVYGPAPSGDSTPTAKRKPSLSTAARVQKLRSAHLNRRQAHASSLTKRRQAQRDRKG
jgi:hypothetical protein